jgi:hypothetical protein
LRKKNENRCACGFGPIAIGMAGSFCEAAFIIFFVQAAPGTPVRNVSDVGLTSSIGSGLFAYLLPFEVTLILLLMAIVGMTLARRGGLLPPPPELFRDQVSRTVGRSETGISARWPRTRRTKQRGCLGWTLVAQDEW